jgi:hypothetical protein
MSCSLGTATEGRECSSALRGVAGPPSDCASHLRQGMDWNEEGGAGRQLSADPGPTNGVVSISGNENCDPDAGINDHLEITPHVPHGLKR